MPRGRRWLLASIVALAWLIPRPAAALGAVVQTCTCTFGNSTTCTMAWAGCTNATNLGAGHAVGVFIFITNGFTVTAIGDGGTNTWTAGPSSTAASTEALFSYTAKNTTTSGNNVVIQISSTEVFGGAFLYETSGEDGTTPLDTSDANNGTLTANVTSNPITTTTTGIVLVCGAQFNFSSWTAGTNYTLDAQPASGVAGCEHRITVGPLVAEVQQIVSNVNTNWAIVTLAFKDGSVTPPTTACTLTMTGAGKCDD